MTIFITIPGISFVVSYYAYFRNDVVLNIGNLYTGIEFTKALHETNTTLIQHAVLQTVTNYL